MARREGEDCLRNGRSPSSSKCRPSRCARFTIVRGARPTVSRAFRRRAARLRRADLGRRGHSCAAGEPFADEDAAAFCSGVLVDWDLVLTAGHCVHLLALQDFWVVFRLRLRFPGHIAASDTDLATPIAVVSEALDPEGVEPRLDYAWIGSPTRWRRPAVPHPPALPRAVRGRRLSDFDSGRRRNAPQARRRRGSARRPAG